MTHVCWPEAPSTLPDTVDPSKQNGTLDGSCQQDHCSARLLKWASCSLALVTAQLGQNPQPRRRHGHPRPASPASCHSQELRLRGRVHGTLEGAGASLGLEFSSLPGSAARPARNCPLHWGTCMAGSCTPSSRNAELPAPPQPCAVGHALAHRPRPRPGCSPRPHRSQWPLARRFQSGHTRVPGHFRQKMAPPRKP